MPGSNNKKLEIQDKIASFMQMMGLDAPDAQNNQLYTDFTSSINAITEGMAPFFAPDEEGNYKPLDSESKKSFDLLYQNAINAASGIINSPDQSKAALFRKDMAKSIFDLLNQDKKTLNQLDTRYGLSMPEILQESRTDVVDLTGQQLGSVGGLLSSRIPMSYVDKNGVEKRGFFTKSSNVRSMEEMQGQLNDKIEELGTKYPEYSGILEESFRTMNVGDFFNDQEYGPEQIEGTIRRLVDDVETKYPNFAEITKDESFCKAFNEINLLGTKLTSEYQANTQALGLKTGENIDSRSTAMSVVADLLGKSKLIANSRSMKIKVGNQIFEGTFIDEAVGKDVTRINDPNDPMANATEEQLDNPKVNKDLCDLAVLDIICGNLDRHNGNMFYQFDESGKITGICGIDNDTSFPNKEMVTERGMGLNSHPLDHDLAISEEMAAKIMSLDADTLKYALAGTKLEPEAIRRTAERLETVQNRIRSDLEYFKDKEPSALEEGHLHVIKDENWKDISLRRLAIRNTALKDGTAEKPKEQLKQREFKGNPAAKVFFVDRTAKENLETNKIKNPEAKSISFAKGKLIEQNVNVAGRTKQLNIRLDSHKKDLTTLAKGFQYLDKNLKLSKPSEYSAFEKAYKKCFDRFAQRIDPNNKSRKINHGPLSQDEISAFADSFREVKEYGDLCAEKLGKKKNLSENEKQLLTAVNGIRNVLSQKAVEFDSAIGAKTVTNQRAAQVLWERANAIEKKTLASAKPNSADLATALATKKLAKELAAMPKSSLYSKKLAMTKMTEYRSSKEIVARSKDVDACRAMAAQQTVAKQFSKGFFFKDFVDQNGSFKEELPSKLNLSVSRHAMCTLAVSLMLKQGHSLEDIFNEEKLQTEREQAGKDIMDLYKNADEITLKNVTADLLADGLEMAMNQTSESLGKLPAINGSELSKPQNVHLITAARLIQDMGQELGRKEILSTAKEMYGNAHISKLLSMQHGGCLALNGIADGHFAKANLAAGNLEAFNGYNEKAIRNGNNDELVTEIQEKVLPEVIINAANEKLVAQERSKPGFNFFKNFDVTTTAGTSAGTIKASAKMLMDETMQLSGYLTAGDLKAQAMTLGTELLKGNIVSEKTVASVNMEGITLAPFGKALSKLPVSKSKEPAKHEPEQQTVTKQQGIRI